MRFFSEFSKRHKNFYPIKSLRKYVKYDKKKKMFQDERIYSKNGEWHVFPVGYYMNQHGKRGKKIPYKIDFIPTLCPFCGWHAFVSKDEFNKHIIRHCCDNAEYKGFTVDVKEFKEVLNECEGFENI